MVKEISSTKCSIVFNTKIVNYEKYINEVIRHSSIMQRQGFWVGLTKYELNEEIQLQKKESHLKYHSK